MNHILDNTLLLINKIYPGLLDDGFEIIGNGFGSLVIESSEGVIIRIAKNLGIAKQYIKEIKVLPNIRHLIDVDIPNPGWQMYNPDTIPPGIMAYEKIKGIPIASDKIGIRNRSTIGRQVAKFIISFHQIPYEGLELAKNNDREKLMLLYRDTFNSLERELTTPELDIDLAPQLYLGEDFYNDVLEEYTKVFSEDEDIGKRAMKHQELRELRGLQYAIKYNDKDEFTD